MRLHLGFYWIFHALILFALAGALLSPSPAEVHLESRDGRTRSLGTLNATAPQQDLPDDKIEEDDGDVVFGTAFRLSDFLRVSALSDRGRVIRSMLMSYRLFRDHRRTRRDLIATIVVDMPLPDRSVESMFRELRSVDVQFTLRYPDIPDTTPLYAHAMRGMLASDASSFVYVKAESLLFADTSKNLIEAMHSNEVACMPYLDADRKRFISSAGSIAELVGSGPGAQRALAERAWCSSSVLFIKSRSVLSDLVYNIDAATRALGLSKIITDFAEERGGVPVSALTAADVGEGVLNAVLASSSLGIKARYLHHCEGAALICQACASNATDYDVSGVNYCADDAPLELVIFPEDATTHLAATTYYDSVTIENLAFISNKLIFPELAHSKLSAIFFRAGDDFCDIDGSLFQESLRSRNAAHVLWIQAQIRMRLSMSDYSCPLIASSMSAVPNADYVEFGSSAVGRRAELWNVGRTIPQRSAKISTDIDTSDSGHKFITPRSFHIVASTAVDLSARLNEYLSVYEALPANARYVYGDAIIVPCALYAEIDYETAMARSDGGMCQLFDAFKERIYTLGYIPSVVRCDDDLHALLLTGPHCTKRSFQRISHLFRKEMADQLRHIAKKPYSTGLFDQKSQASIIPFVSTVEPVGNIVANIPGHEFRVFDKPLDDRIVDLLVGRLLHKSTMQPMGASSFFVPFNNSKPRSLIEAVILEHIAPIVVGDQNTARKNGFIGAEWWMQLREEDDPKEYHMDTAITWCRDAGWPKEYLGSCPYYPAVGSVVYLTDEGGPTAIFNQSSDRYGMKPTLPVEIAAVFPKRNRMMLFNGKRFHGVMRKKRCVPTKTAGGEVRPCKPRVTLLVNYWKERTAGEPYTVTVPQEGEYLRHYYNMKTQLAAQNAGQCTGYSCHASVASSDLGDASISVSAHVGSVRPLSSLVNIRVNRKFEDDFLQWLNQTIPEPFMNAIVDTYPSFQYADGTREYGWLNNEWLKQLPRSGHKIEKSAPAVLFTLNQSKWNEEERTDYMHYWNHWKLDQNGSVSMTEITINATAIEEWWNGMPGGNPFMVK